MYLLPMGHPSGRHSGDACNFDPACKDSPNSVDWSNPDLRRWPKFRDLLANEVILAPGDFLYLPTHWFHYIISLGLNYQCNTRSGRGNEYAKTVRKCGESAVVAQDKVPFIVLIKFYCIFLTYIILSHCIFVVNNVRFQVSRE